MEKNNKTTSSFSICRKIRQVFAINPAFKTVHRVTQYNQESAPQHIKYVNIEGGGNNGSIPITFDNSMIHGHTSKITLPHVGISERKGNLTSDPKLAQSRTVTRVEPDDQQYVRKGNLTTDPRLAQSRTVTRVEHNDQQYVNIKQGTMIGGKKPLKVGLVNLEKQGKKSTLDINDTFDEYINRAKNRIRTVSNVGKGQNNHDLDESNSFSGVNRMENLNDHFSDFIVQAKKRIRTTSNIGKTNNSLKRG
ncbi:hypothetical protein TSUD_333210 [Trifolium subterraneum]|uniref:Uncharacterized protein n=1 Tax=Trifolium subterraneum TaxID=3900 RepID=A0A2Z6N6M8_TRISU|nr:hypothetical protein TSUD_333210 [Trifolium subterraneum]